MQKSGRSLEHIQLSVHSRLSNGLQTLLSYVFFFLLSISISISKEKNIKKLSKKFFKADSLDLFVTMMTIATEICSAIKTIESASVRKASINAMIKLAVS